MRESRVRPTGQLARERRRCRAQTIALLAALGGLTVAAPGSAVARPGDGPGSFGAPFLEPTVGPGYGYPRTRTPSQDPDDPAARCVERRARPGGGDPQQGGITRGFIDCKPAAGALNLLPSGLALYWDNLAGTENVELSIGSEYGVVGLNDQARRMDVRRRRWRDTTPVDGGAVSRSKIEPLLPSELFRTHSSENDGSLFCADNNFLADGRVFANGGTRYENDPGNDASKFGSTELYGIENTRIYDPRTNRWSQAASMHKPRWYPTTTTLADGRQFTVSGLRKLVKPVNRQGPITAIDQADGFGVQEGQNERVTETWVPPGQRTDDGRLVRSRRGRWIENPSSARRSLPLFARMHLLPNGHPYYNAAGQSFSPEGQAFDEATWNIAASYDPQAKRWSDLGVPGVGAVAVPGFRGSTFSVMMPLRPDRRGNYRRADFLTAGGVLNPPSPGGYFAVRDSFVTTIRTNGDRVTLAGSRATGPLAPTSSPAFGRWYSSGTLLPTGDVLATSGADRDEVVGPGFEIPVKQAELFDARTRTWRRVATANQQRTYHNTAVLLPDARVLVGGHAVISNAYLSNRTVVPGQTAQQDTGRDPSFEIYRPPYLACPGRQARIRSVTRTGARLRVETDVPARGIRSVVLVRNASVTHVTDADQRSVELRVLSRRGNVLTVAGPPNGNVAPPGPYMLFANRSVRGCVKPSRARQLFVGRGGRVKVRGTQARPRFTG